MGTKNKGFLGWFPAPLKLPDQTLAAPLRRRQTRRLGGFRAAETTQVLPFEAAGTLAPGPVVASAAGRGHDRRAGRVPDGSEALGAARLDLGRRSFRASVGQGSSHPPRPADGEQGGGDSLADRPERW